MAIYSGHFRSSIIGKAVNYKGDAVPWLTYPANDFLATRNFTKASVLEFGGGQSTIYWSKRAQKVTVFELNEAWIDYIDKQVGHNVQLIHAPQGLENQTNFITTQLDKLGQKYDLIIIDDLHRREMFDIVVKYLNEGGMIVCDNAESYEFPDYWKKHPQFMRIDFYGHAPGVLHPHLTTIHFDRNCKYMNYDVPIYSKAYNLKNMP
jgi:hypothetical protein